MVNIFDKRIKYNPEEKVNFLNEFNEDLETSETLGFNEEYRNKIDSNGNDKIIEFDIVEDDDPIIKLLKRVINNSNVKVQDFIDAYGHNSGNNLINSLKNRKNLQGRSRKKVMKLLNKMLIVGILDDIAVQNIEDPVFVIISKSDLHNINKKYEIIDSEIEK